jgi:hypothetical protein
VSRLFPTGIDLAKREIKQAAAQNLASAPSAPSIGQFYLDTSLTPPRLRMWNGTDWLIRSDDADLLGGQNGAYYRARANHTGQQAASTISDFDTQVRSNRLNQLATPDATVLMNNQKISGLAEGTNPTEAVNRAQLDAAVAGLRWKEPVRYATTTNITLSGLGTQPGGDWPSPLTAGDRILVRAQTAGAENGLYAAAGGAWVRTTDADSAAEIQGMAVLVMDGATLANTGYQQTADAVTLGTTPLAYVQWYGGQTYTAGDGMTQSGTTFNVVEGVGIDVTANAVAIDTTITARWKHFLLSGVASSYPCVHNLGNRWPTVTVWRAASPFDVIDPNIFATDTNTVTVDFEGESQADGAWRVTVAG